MKKRKKWIKYVIFNVIYTSILMVVLFWQQGQIRKLTEASISIIKVLELQQDLFNKLAIPKDIIL